MGIGFLWTRHKVFISYHHANDQYYHNLFESMFAAKAGGEKTLAELLYGQSHGIFVTQSVQIGEINPYLTTDTIRIAMPGRLSFIPGSQTIPSPVDRVERKRTRQIHRYAARNLPPLYFPHSSRIRLGRTAACGMRPVLRSVSAAERTATALQSSFSVKNLLIRT